PCLLKGLLLIAPSEAPYSVESVLRSPARPGNGALSGAVETRFESTSTAAAATAASTEALAPVRLSSRYGRCRSGPIALTASYTAPCTIPRLTWCEDAAPPFGAGIAARV